MVAKICSAWEMTSPAYQWRIIGHPSSTPLIQESRGQIGTTVKILSLSPCAFQLWKAAEASSRCLAFHLNVETEFFRDSESLEPQFGPAVELSKTGGYGDFTRSRLGFCGWKIGIAGLSSKLHFPKDNSGKCYSRVRGRSDS